MNMIEALTAFAAEVETLPLRDSQLQHSIDGLVYTSTKLPCSKGLEVLTSLTALLGRGLTKQVATGDMSGINLATLTSLAEAAMRVGVVDVIRQLLSQTSVGTLRSGGQPGSAGGNVSVHLDTHFAGEYMHLLKVCVLAVAHNFRGPTLGVL
jgi:hypothetical protein